MNSPGSEQARFTAEASAELAAAARWYEQQHAGLGLALLAAVDAAVESMMQWPQAGARVPGLGERHELRRVRVGRFPYHVVYLATDPVIHVLAVAHDRRRPGYWSARIEP